MTGPDDYGRRLDLAEKAADAAQRIAEDLAQLEHMAPLVSALSQLAQAHAAIAEQLAVQQALDRRRPPEPDPDGPPDGRIVPFPGPRP